MNIGRRRDVEAVVERRRQAERDAVDVVSAEEEARREE